MAIAQGAVDLVRGLRSTAHIRNRQPLATAWLALPDRGLAIDRDLLDLIADEINLKEVVVIADDSALVERRVKPLLPRIGKRLGSAIPAVMAAARAGEVTFESDGSVTLAGVTLAPDEVEIQATPRPGHRRRPSRRAGRRPRHGADPGARRGGRRPRARRGRSRTSGARPASSSTTGSTCGCAAFPQPSRRTWPASPRTRSPTSPTGDAPADAPTATVELAGGPVVIALRRRVADGRRHERRRARRDRRTRGGHHRHETDRGALARLPRHGGDGLRARPDLEGLAGVQPEAGRDRAGHRRLRPARSSARTPARCSACSATTRSCSGSCRSSSWR